MLRVEDYRTEIKRLYAEMRREQDLADQKIEDNEEWAAADDAIAAEYMPRIAELERAVMQIGRSSQPTSERFAQFCKHFSNAQLLTGDQLSAFAEYAKPTTSCRYKTPVTQYSAIVDGVRYCTAGRQIYLEPVAML